VLDALLRIADMVMKPVGGAVGRRRELRVARRRVVARLEGMRVAEGKAWDDEKWRLGAELDRFGEAIGQANAGPEWSDAEHQIRGRVLLAGDRGAIDECLGLLGRLG
jgi:hypothetical protein